VDIVNKTYEPPPVIHGLMMLLASTAFVSGVMRKDNNGNGK